MNKKVTEAGQQSKTPMTTATTTSSRTPTGTRATTNNNSNRITALNKQYFPREEAERVLHGLLLVVEVALSPSPRKRSRCSLGGWRGLLFTVRGIKICKHRRMLHGLCHRDVVIILCRARVSCIYCSENTRGVLSRGSFSYRIKILVSCQSKQKRESSCALHPLAYYPLDRRSSRRLPPDKMLNSTYL